MHASRWRMREVHARDVGGATRNVAVVTHITEPLRVVGMRMMPRGSTRIVSCHNRVQLAC